MIKCNLAVLLAERGLKMADVINDTSLSKTAVRGLYYNQSKGIQFETLEIICNYLNVGPEDVIKKITFFIEIIERKPNYETGSVEYKLKFTFDDKIFTEFITIGLKNADYLKDELATTFSSTELWIDFSFNNELKQTIFSQLTEIEKERLDYAILSNFMRFMKLENHNITFFTYNHNESRSIPNILKMTQDNDE